MFVGGEVVVGLGYWAVKKEMTVVCDGIGAILWRQGKIRRNVWLVNGKE